MSPEVEPIRAVWTDGGVDLVVGPATRGVVLGYREGEQIEVAAPGGHPTLWVPAQVAVGDVVSVELWTRWGVVGPRSVLVEGPPLVPAAAGAPGRLAIVDVALPVDAQGRDDFTRTPNQLVTAVGWGGGSVWGGGHLPAAWQRVSVANPGDGPALAAVVATVVDEDGEAVAAFDYRGRDTRSPWTRALVEVPGRGQAEVVLPLWVDPAGLPEDGRWTRHITVSRVGDPSPQDPWTGPLELHPVHPLGPALAWAGAVGAVVGWTGFLTRVVPSLSRWRPAELVRLGMLVTFTGAVGALSSWTSLAVGAALGPLGPIVLGLPDDVLRYGLTIVALRQRPALGTASTMAVLLMGFRWLAVGSITPWDPLYTGVAIAAQEAALWGCGVWRRGARDRARLGLALVLASLFVNAVVLAISVTVYGQHLAGWWVLSVLGVAGVVAPALAVLPGSRWADRLDEVAP